MLLSIVFAVALILLAVFVWENFGRSGQPPGPLKFPIIGSLIQVSIADKMPHIAIDKLSKKYGKLMSIKMGLQNSIFIADYNTFKDIFTMEETNERKLSGVLLKRQFYNLDIGLIFNNGTWEESRKFCTESLKNYGFGDRRTMESRFQHEMDAFYQELESKRHASENIVDFTRDLFDPIVINNMLYMLTGERLSREDEVVKELIFANNLIVSNGLIYSGLLAAFPFLAYLFPKMLGTDVQLKGMNMLHNVSKNILENRERKGEYKTNPNCFVDDFLRKMESSSSPVFTTQSFQVIFMDLLQAGFETTSASINFATLLISSHPEVQNILFNEIRDICGADRPPSIADRPNMPYAQSVIIEAIRWSRILVFGALRSASKDFKFEKYLIRKGTLLFPNFHSIFFDEEFWKDPYVFRPGRFLDENRKIIKDKVDRVAAFGIGRRNCFGEIMARDVMFLYITGAFQRYKFSVPENRPQPNLEPKLGMSYGPHPYSLLVEHR